MRFPLRVGVLGTLVGVFLYQAAAWAGASTARGSRDLRDLELVNVRTGEGVQFSSLVERACGHVYLYDLDCPACEQAFGNSGDRAVPREPSEGADFLYWLSLDTDPERVRTVFSAQTDLPDNYILADRDDAAKLDLSAIPALWKIRNGEVTHEETGVSFTSVRALRRNPALRCSRR